MNRRTATKNTHGCSSKLSGNSRSERKLTNRRNARWWWYRRRNFCRALVPNATCPAAPATALLGGSWTALVRLRFLAPTPTSPRAPPLLRQSALLLGFVLALSTDRRSIAPTPIPTPPPTEAGSLPSSRFRVTVMPHQNEGEARAEAAPLQRTRASLCA